MLVIVPENFNFCPGAGVVVLIESENLVKSVDDGAAGFLGWSRQGWTVSLDGTGVSANATDVARVSSKTIPVSVADIFFINSLVVGGEWFNEQSKSNTR